MPSLRTYTRPADPKSRHAYETVLQVECATGGGFTEWRDIPHVYHPDVLECAYQGTCGAPLFLQVGKEAEVERG